MQAGKYNNIKIALVLTLVCMALTLPFLGITDFNTKGEPREALVVMAMEEDNLIFPFSGSGDIAYKPPFFHWCVWGASKVTGHLNEFSSRLPSAIAFYVMLFCLVLQVRTRREAILAALLLFSMFEVHRSASACRVDMMLAGCMTLVLCSLYRWALRGLRGFPIWAVVGMGLAVLTKGPVGIALPCFIGFLFALIRRSNSFGRIAVRYLMVFLVSLPIPLAWYVKAYSIAGDTFLRLVEEENLGRFLGRMSYESHNAPFFMPFIFLLSGTLPYSLLLFAYIPTAFKKWGYVRKDSIRNLLEWARERFLHLSPFAMFSLLAAGIITIFFCIPGSKRSVYLLPAYPFVAYCLSLLMMHTKKRIILRFTWILAALGCILSLLLLAIKYGPAIHGIDTAGKDTAIFYYALRNSGDSLLSLLLTVAPLLCLPAYFLIPRLKRFANARMVYLPALCTVMIYLILDALVLPAVLNTKSDRHEALAVETIVPRGETIYSYCDGAMMRFFAINFYTGNRVRPFALSPAEKSIKAQVVKATGHPDEGYILIADKDFDKFDIQYGKDYEFSIMYRSKKKGCDVRDYFGLYKFKKR